MHISALTLTHVLVIIHVLGNCVTIDEVLYSFEPWRHHHSPRKGYPCRTPNNEAAYCLSLFTCPTLLLALGSLQPIALDFVKKSLCESPSGDVVVCCGTMGNYTEFQNSISNNPVAVTPDNRIKQVETTTEIVQPIIEEKPKRSFHDNALLSNRKYCGFQHTDDRFNFDNSTALDEFPWLVDITFLDPEDEDPEQYLDRCNGVLINNRYVLTTEYCGTYPRTVKLGQYNTNKTVSCLGNTELDECTEPILEIPIEEEIHRLNVSNGWHDFTLLRLANKVSFTDFVRPICLPLDDSEVLDRSELLFSGWGATNESGINKKRLKYQPTDVSECYKLDDKGLENVTSVVPVCLLPINNNGVLACTGDESGPLMYTFKRRQWFVDSLITRVYSKLTDPNFCSDELPITGIKVTMDVVEWIVNNIHV